MSRLQITIGQSEILMALRSILNCSNDELIPRVTELAARYREERQCFLCDEKLKFNWLYCPVCGERVDGEQI